MAKKVQHARAANDAGLSVVVIGAGISGILLGIKLRERGIHDFVILEKGATLGGTWRDNMYPGAACDVAAHSYVYSFAPNPAWKSRYAKAPDIWRYYNDCARRYGVLPHIRYGQEVVSADFRDDRWEVRTADGGVFVADVVIAACGRLHHPMMPEITGRDRFAGPSFHTSRWDRSLDLRGKRLGVIGTGSTATQIVAALAGEVGGLSLFQRTPQWVFPVADTPIPWWKRLAYRFLPGHASRYYYQLQRETETRGRAATGDRDARAARDRQCTDALATVRDPELRARLTPDYEVGCKRLVMSGTFYEAVQKPGVQVVTDAIDHITENGIVTRDGTLHEVDVLAYATGFDAHAYLRPMRITGEDGITLDQVWRDLPLAYRSIAIPHMPNLFLVNGPYSPGGSASVVGIVEAQVDYILKLLDRIEQADVAIVPREDAARAWLDDVREQARGSVWGTGGCQSWYLDKTGTPSIDPTPLSELVTQLATVNLADYRERPRAPVRLGAAA
ncbi:flavin-containing monooxygenase [Sphingomonas solaris]|uniref:NAD(P)/FAD-dependent oxidoreductase n=1 Tax=Alterirhizorhabdus solaris TaxID=2529389 RepID=A0A558R3F6_9SPHN|nr:NAD(P)/FAD-dependent oxidoreductase [Sphingomonas solaris]TVV73910.1 NAD(P)/FAD-dependent oxidoreductase [Sphingomonas solaris]